MILHWKDAFLLARIMDILGFTGTCIGNYETLFSENDGRDKLLLYVIEIVGSHCMTAEKTSPGH